MQFPEEILRTTWLRRIAAVLAITGFVLAVMLGFSSPAKHLSDFSGYYTAAYIVAHHDSIPQMYNDAWFKEQVKHLGLQDTGMAMYVNPPPISLVMLPFVWLEPYQAKLIWNAFNIILIFVIWFLAKQCFEIPSKSEYKIILFGLLASTLPFLRNLQRGQLYVVMLLFVLMFWKGYMKNNSWLTAISLSILLLLKYFGWMFLILLAVERRWKDILLTLCCFIIGTLGTLSVVGTDTYLAHVERLMAAFLTNDSAITRLPCVPAFFGGLFVYHPMWNRQVLFNAPFVALLLTLVTLVTMLFITLEVKDRADDAIRSRKFFGVLVLSVIFAPLAAEHHFVLLALAVFIVLNRYLAREVISRREIIGVALLVYSVLGWYPSFITFNDHWWTGLVSYTRLYGSVALWILLVRSQVNTESNPVGQTV